MIVILSDSEDDYAYNIIEWLNFYKQSFLKIDLFQESERKMEVSMGDKNEIRIGLNKGNFIELNDVSYFFYRSGNFNLRLNYEDDETLTSDIKSRFLQMEFDTLVDFVYSKIRKKCLGWVDQKPLNKLLQLDTAQQLDIAVPNTHIVNSKSQFKRIFKNEGAITKAIQENLGMQTATAIYMQRVKEVTADDLPDEFYPSLFQEKLNKILEIRTFYLDGEFHSIAFRNINESESVDMRDNYSNHINYKFVLPKKIEQKLHQLMQLLQLKIGSIDLILCEDQEFYFLEVNTEGQYEWVSEGGGYNIDKKIAEFLIHKENEHQG